MKPIASLTAFFPICASTMAATIHVDANATAFPRNGSSWCNAHLNLSDALAAAAFGDTILVADGTYKPKTAGLADPRTATFLLKRGVVVEGGFAGCGAVSPGSRNPAVYLTTLSGDLNGDDQPDFGNYDENVYHVVSVDDPAITQTTVLDGFMIRGGYANGTLAAKTDQGGGIHNFNGTNPFTAKPLVRNCIIKENWAANHGAVNDHGGMTLINCEFRDNHSGMWGGGLYVHHDLVTTVTDCRFYNNHTDGTSGGGGAVVNEGDITFTRCLFEGNRSEKRGGAIYLHQSMLQDTLVRFTDCAFKDNFAVERGGAVYAINFVIQEYANCVFDGNGAGGHGGAVYFVPRRFSFTNCVFRNNWNNPASFGGGAAVYHINSSDEPEPRPQFTNCLFVTNQAGAGGSLFFYLAHPNFTNCVFYGNTSGTSPGAITFGGDSHGYLTNCIFWENGTSQTEGEQIRVSDDQNGSVASALDVNHTIIQGWTGALGGANNFGLDPEFVDPWGPDEQLGTGDDNFVLSATSPALDAGDNNALPPDVADLDGDGNITEAVPTDLFGAARVTNGSVDLGVAEWPSGAPCPPGQFSPTGMTPCQDCPPGTAQPGTGSTSCPACQSGFHQPLAGQTACLTCSCDDSDACTLDSCHSVTGVCENETVCVVPAVSHWALAAFGLLLSAAGTIAAGRRIKR